MREVNRDKHASLLHQGINCHLLPLLPCLDDENNPNYKKLKMKNGCTMANGSSVVDTTLKFNVESQMLETVPELPPLK